ncbi:uncharacterized protein LOC124388418 isoform X2 [Silurus meridionalis]|uniref:uncharacterized protein LOC124388418 isoform X2 n=1 Tax=Silurus meridionalis TaxID=175797 RepID=UPI001EE9D4A8|nr:uncharacterized protein LOC124388418 isoform X2 [Silurus meridionalis]
MLAFAAHYSYQVDSTDTILREHRRVEYQVKSRKQLSTEDGYVEVHLPSRSRHGQAKILPAKILLLGDVYKDLIVKRDAFKRGEDIWKTSTQQRKKPIEAVASTSKFQPQLQVSQKAANVAMGDRLKRDLQKLHRKKTAPVTSTPLSDDLDDTEIDLFQNRDESEQRRSRKRAAVLDSESEQEDNDDDNNDGRTEFENSLLQGTSASPQKTHVVLDDDVVKALKELPGIVSSLKNVLEAMKQG